MELGMKIPWEQDLTKGRKRARNRRGIGFNHETMVESRNITSATTLCLDQCVLHLLSLMSSAGPRKLQPHRLLFFPLLLGRCGRLQCSPGVIFRSGLGFR